MSYLCVVSEVLWTFQRADGVQDDGGVGEEYGVSEPAKGHPHPQ